jgi:hypothetical protein
MTLGSTPSLTKDLPWGGKDSRCVGLTTLPPSCADRLQILEASTSWSPMCLCRPVMGKLYVFITERNLFQIRVSYFYSKILIKPKYSSF